MNRLEEIETRMSAIGTELEVEGADLDALEAESRSLKEERDALIAEEEKRAAERAAIANGSTTVTIRKDVEHMEEIRTFAVDSAEYRNAFLKKMMGKELDAEERTAMTATGAVPIMTMNKVMAAFEKSPILAKVNMTHFPGYVRVPVETTANEASWSSTSTDSQDSVTYIDLVPYQLIKTVEVPAAAAQMGIDAFEEYLVKQLTAKVESALQKAVIVGAGSGSSQPEGIATTVTTTAGTFTLAGVTKGDLLGIMAELGGKYQSGATWIMPASVFYGEVMAIADHNTFASLNEGFDIKLLGHDVILDDNATISSADYIFYGDLSQYVLNMAEDIEISASSEVAFRNNSKVYRAVAQADGKLAQADAFVKFTRSTT